MTIGTALHSASAATMSPPDDERALLVRFESLLEREEAAVAAHDADVLAAVAEERVVLTGQLADAARRRSAGRKLDAAQEAALLERYRRLRHRHDVRAQVVRRHADHNSRALGVLAQATGETSVYKADGTVALQFASL